MEQVKHAIDQACKDVFNVAVEVVLTRPDEQFGDYATNVALQLAKQVNKNPRQVADELLAAVAAPVIAKTEVAGPGFINIWLTDEALLQQLEAKVDQPYANKVVVAEYSDPNPFKVLHAGHLYTSVVGDAVANLFATAGGEVHRVNFGGDVGLHVGRTLWAILQKLGGEQPQKMAVIPPEQRADWLAEAYVEGTAAYETDQAAKQAIVELNKRVYQIQRDKDKDSPLAQIYWTGRQWSYDYFATFYKRIGSEFERYYPESEVEELGVKTVREQLKKGVFKESDGAIIFPGEDHDLHTRVFINSQGLPTYEAKDVGLILQKYNDYHFDTSLVITGNEQAQYMQVVLKALEQFEPDLARSTIHRTHGLVKLAGGVKMSSRKGNILRAVDVLDVAKQAAESAHSSSNESIVLAAVKYAFLKNRMGGDIIYDPAESVALEGNSGPYLQYAHARACSILAKKSAQAGTPTELDANERSLVRKMTEFTEVTNRAVQELMPHYICTYLYELAQTFNRFYEKNRVIDDPRQTQRLQLIAAYAAILKQGLTLLNIDAPEKI